MHKFNVGDVVRQVRGALAGYSFKVVEITDKHLRGTIVDGAGSHKTDKMWGAIIENCELVCAAKEKSGIGSPYPYTVRLYRPHDGGSPFPVYYKPYEGYISSPIEHVWTAGCVEHKLSLYDSGFTKDEYCTNPGCKFKRSCE